MDVKPHHRTWCTQRTRRTCFTITAGCFGLVMVLSLVAVTNIDVSSGGSASTPRPNGSNESVLQSRPPSMYPHLDDLDPLPPRIGENFITYGAFLDCLAARLRVDRHKKRELPISSDEPFFPYLVAPITFEIRELKAFTCNVTIPIKHFMIVHNYNLSSVKEFLDATAPVFAFTDRLQIRRFPRNRGYAGALNEAMRHALTFPFDEVPFFFMSNYDVRFSRGLLERALPRINASAFAGKPLLEAFKAEVATEPNEHTPPHFRDVPLRSTDGTHLLHTSPSLPDRVRYMSKADREAVFRNHPGFYFLNSFHQTAVWGLSRLGLEMAGFFDENCFPAYYEDTDYVSRLTLLGLRPFTALSQSTGVVHHERNMLNTESAHELAASLGDALAFLRGMGELLAMGLPYYYVDSKPRMVNMSVPVPKTDSDSPPPPLLPPDAWVLNEKRQLAIEEVAQLCISFSVLVGVATPRRSRDVVIAFAPRSRHRELKAALDPYFNAADLYRWRTTLRLRAQ